MKKTIGFKYEFEHDGKMLTFMRHLNRLTQEQLAEKLGVKQAYIAKLEKTKEIKSIKTLHKISNACGITLFPPKFACKECSNEIENCRCKIKIK